MSTKDDGIYCWLWSVTCSLLYAIIMCTRGGFSQVKLHIYLVRKKPSLTAMHQTPRTSWFECRSPTAAAEIAALLGSSRHHPRVYSLLIHFLTCMCWLLHTNLQPPSLTCLLPHYFPL